MTLIFHFLVVFPLILAVEVEAAGEVLVTGNGTILGENGTFRMGFFSVNGGPDGYFGIWYASLPTPTYVWVANRETPVKSKESATVEVEVGGDGRLKIMDVGGSVVWQTTNEEKATAVKLLESGNLVLLSPEKKVVWQSFDFPADTWLPGMNMTADRSITCWKSSIDPSPGLYSLRLKPPDYGEFELVFNGTTTYWTTGNWTEDKFAGVPEMTIPYIYKFHFLNPFTPAAAFWYTVMPLESGGGGGRPPLNRFHVDSAGLLRQYTWFSQGDTWNNFWSQPENRCRVYGLCGNLGLCNTVKLNPCECLDGFQPSEELNWSSGDFSGGCRRKDSNVCSENDDEFEGIGSVSFNEAALVPIPGNPKSCEASCLTKCSCIGLFRNARSNSCYNVYGSVLNLKNLSSDSTEEGELRVRVHRRGNGENNRWKLRVLIASIAGFSTVLGISMAVLLVFRRRRQRKKQVEEEDVFSVTNLKVFSYKELNAATQSFSEKLGRGGFGTVFKGELSDSSQVAVKRLERPGGGEKEFRAEVCTIGNIQHVNLVRLRGFCSENSHRLLVYDYMQNGPLSVFLRRDGENLSWDVRFRVAVGTARGIAYLHEECRDCIIHCDIKPENILLDSDYIPKVSDFGLAKLMGRDFSRVLATMRGTWGYVAPEWISGVAITAKADVYSYGMTLLELIGGRRNVETPPSADAAGGNAGGDEWFFPPWAARQIIEGNTAAVVDVRLKDSYSTAEAERVGLVAVWCIQDEEAARPTMGMVVKMLEGVVEVAVPPPPKLLQALVSGESFRGVVAESGGGTSTGDDGNSHSSQSQTTK